MTSSVSTRRNAFGTANPHALATILEASETRRIISATDIYDISGIKLWASNQPVSAALQRKLLDRELREPLETSLVAQDGVSPATLADAVRALLAKMPPLAILVGESREYLLGLVSQLNLHPVAQLLLTAAQTARPERFEHAVAAMVLNGALMASDAGDDKAVRMAMLSGLLHDLGEMYIGPDHGEAEADRDLDFESYQQLVVHPHVGYLLVLQLTNYPPEVARAIAEHHEKLDGSGYPNALQADDLSRWGRMLAVTEATLQALRSPYSHLLHASVALRAVPGEFDLHWVGKITAAASAQPPQAAVLERQEVEQRLAALDAVLNDAEEGVRLQAASADLPAHQGALTLAAFLLQRLRTGWNESGLWNPESLATADAAEVEALEDELYFRLRGIKRSVLLRGGHLPEPYAGQLLELCDSFAMGAGLQSDGG
ncbi:HD domain-containing protein [Acidovorax sp. DW039]|uniref:HD-GYP domain-containing protein n=1 Tax=Acidovorax sp. DW039 TaxID=3095606 RepID=UPI00308995B0|nr:HD domain-containing protein [Acidovorax sp. DW039]